MQFIINTIKNMFLDLLSMVRGFTYGFVMIGLFILLGGALLNGFLYLKNVWL
ncbi:hypothetical protein GCM10010954_21510 [Halobacillus andaensis]|uniref:Uncharacterized protein n=1 Tax=Halobacillus andaensis TaxID=1176239 RepID=A0A917EVJ3_HALAA|nr:hypothetical protein [Halobacillus andaensis]GGF22398.1 hypothetical protein GCM10010954_21510 [Halobacillus andaensis]